MIKTILFLFTCAAIGWQVYIFTCDYRLSAAVAASAVAAGLAARFASWKGERDE
ncbi:MAG: hypothetical protein K5981_02120 [Clostridia bacterium]|nr:hypothetical protein [Clostridia bacterium]